MMKAVITIPSQCASVIITEGMERNKGEIHVVEKRRVKRME